LGHSTSISVAGPRFMLRRSIPSDGTRHEHRGTSNGTTLSLAECLCRTTDRLDPPRMSGPCNDLQRTRVTAHPEIVFCLLRKIAHTFGTGKRFSHSSARPTALDGKSDRHTTSWWSPPSLRTSGRLKAFAPNENKMILGYSCAHICNRISSFIPMSCP
jgi:hypothetical protein